jgi:hypothetical protein
MVIRDPSCCGERDSSGAIFVRFIVNALERVLFASHMARPRQSIVDKKGEEIVKIVNLELASTL